MISIESIYGVDVERAGYLFCQIPKLNYNKCFGKFYEQENDCGERQYVFEIWNNRLPDSMIDWVVLPGIDLTQRHDVYVRSREVPVFVEYSVPPPHRGINDSNTKMFLGFMKMDYYDEFEYMLRSRSITHHTNCYLGRTEDDVYDAIRAKNDREFAFATLPNLSETEENVFHRAKRRFKEVHYDASIE